MDHENLIKTIPQRFPFLMVDKVIEVDGLKRIVGIKNVSNNEFYFQGHYPEYPVMPEVLILEGLIQTANALALKQSAFLGDLASVEQIRQTEFKRAVFPGDQIRMEIETQSMDDETISFQGVALVDGRVVCETQFSLKMKRKPERPFIHPTATVHSSAILGKDVSVGPFSIIGEDVVIGDRTRIEAHVMIEKWTRIGEDNHIHFGCVIGSDAQDVSYGGEKTWVTIGDRNEIREYVTINRSTGENSVTEIGSDNILLTHVHLAHNCKLGNKIVIANSTNVAGHCHVEDFATIGGMTGIHQFSIIGKGAMVGAYTRLPQDIPPFMLCEGNPATIRGVNLIGLKRRGSTREAIHEVKEIFRIVFQSDQNTSQALAELQKHTFDSDEAKHLMGYLLTDTKRGFIKRSEK